ncbi:MAG: hypothetical protein WCT04_19390 [Planctomycetota bacterium]
MKCKQITFIDAWLQRQPVHGQRSSPWTTLTNSESDDSPAPRQDSTNRSTRLMQRLMQKAPAR